MIIWILFALMTTATTAALLHPLASQRLRSAQGALKASDVYRDQLRELDRDVSSGQIDKAQFEYARAETARRLFKAVETGETTTSSSSSSSHRRLRAAVVLILPIVSIGLYVALGAPDMPSQPLAARMENPGHDMRILVAKAERHLVDNPDDGKGWDVLAPIYLKTMQIDQAEKAFRNSIRLLGPSPARLDGLAETLINASDGTVTGDARKALEASLAIEPTNAHAKFYIALSLEQAGKTTEAKAAFEALAKGSPAGAPWLPAVNEHIASNGSPEAVGDAKTLSGPTQAVQRLSGADQQQAIRNMVESLDGKLAADPRNLDGWVRLMRSYAVLKENDKAAAAFARALAFFPASGDEGKQLIALARDLGITTEGTTK
ncbi:c-type cytochrome biogenesis protein CcmI [Rhizobium sp. LjRoot258]|uniref:c-type cytochrome biogenesis protein CcmI n=1 Tax=Rhizobium sp. LjRoot258 TaxID=3342299 RepID=UPI003ECD6EC7